MKPTLSQEESWINTIDWDTQPQGLLQLRNDTMERICRFLPTPRDLLEFALANTQCTTAAIPILWETPSLPVPKKLESFLNTVGSRKNLALYVKEISLCVRDGDCPTVFRPVLDSTLKRHQQDILLIMPRLIMHMVQKCECIEKLKIYGWKLDPMKIETIGATLRQLQSLTIIGSNDTFQRPFVIRNMVSRLRELRLDGDFHVSLEFANTLATRAHALRALEIPLCYGDKRIEKQALTRLCSGKPGELNLTELKLTYASPMQDEDVENVLSAFPNLRSFTLHGTINVTAGIISTAIVKCQNIESIELRAHSQTIVRQVQKPSNQNFPKRWVRASRLKRLLLEYMVLPEKIVEDLAQACDSLVTIGLRNCLHLTDKALIQLIECNERLQTLHIIECELITDQILKGLGVSKASKTIEDVYIEECGSISPRSVYLFCCATTRYRLKQLCFEGYRNLSASILGTFVPPNEDAQNAGWETRVKLDERAIDALASTDTQLNPDLLDIPKDCSLTGEQLILLAKELSIRTDTLTNAIEKIQVECPVGENDSESEQASTYESFGQSMENKPLSRVSSLKNHTLRPTTPALWAHANESAIQQYLPSSASMDDNDSRTVISTTSRTSRHSHRYSTAVTPEPRSETQAGLEEPDMDDDDDEPFEESPRQSTHSSLASEGRSPIPSPSVNGNMTFEDEPFSATTAGSTSMTKATTAVAATAIQHHEEWPALAKTHTENSNRKKTTTTVNGDLGGWGPSTQTAWSQKAQPGPKHSDPQPQQRQKHQEQPQQQWIPYTAERHEHEWQQETLEPYQPAFQRGNNSGASGGSGRGGHNSLIMESDGWGKANNYVPWNDPRNQGFAADLIEKQRNTQFWDGQQYRTSHDTIPVRVKNGATPSMQPPVSAPTVLTPANASLATSNLVNTSWPPLEKAVATSQQPVSSKKASENYGRSSRPREPNPLSSDEDNVEWDDDDDGIIIKTSPEFGPQKTSRIAPQQPARAHSKSLSENTRNVKPIERQPAQTANDGVARWNDFASIGVAEQVIRQEQMARQNEAAAATGNKQTPSFDAQSGYLIDTSDVISKSTIFDSKPTSSAQPTSPHSSLWDDMSGLKMDNNPPTPPPQQQEQPASSSSSSLRREMKPNHLQNNNASNNLLDNTEEDLLSPTENSAKMTTIQQPLTPQVNESRTHTDIVGPDESLEEALFGGGTQWNDKPSATSSDDPQRISTPLFSEGGLSTPTSRRSPSQKPEPEQDSDVDPRGKRLGSFKISIPDKGDCVLKIYMNVTPEESAREFCDTNGIPDMYERVLSLIKKEYDNLKTKKIFQSKSGKKKKSSKKKINSNTESNIPQS